MNVAIIDDERNSRALIKSVIADEGLKIFEADTVGSAIVLLEERNIDVAFLDNEYPDGTSIDILRKLSSVSFKIIFITGHKDYALEAIKFSAIDYLMKPFDPLELKEAFGRACAQLDVEAERINFQNLLQHLQGTAEKNLILKTQELIAVVKVNDIIHCQGDGSYTTFTLANGKKYLTSYSLIYYEELLKSYSFFRSHQSYLINLRMVETFQKKDEMISMRNGDQIPLASRRRSDFIGALKHEFG